jgi:hypothetical protein
MAENEVKEVQLDDENLSQEDYKKARAEGKTVVEQPVEKPIEELEKEIEQEEEPEAAEEKPKVSGGFQKRIQRLTKEKAAAEEKAADLEKRLQALESKEKAAPTSNEEPKTDDFKTYEEYLKAFARWEVKQELKAEREAAQKASDEAQASEIWEAHNDRVIAAKAKYEDYDDVVNVPTPWTLENPTPQERASAEAFRIAVLEDDNSAEILYHYGSHPEEFEKLGELTPAQVVKAIARLSDKIVPAKEEKAEEKHEKPKSKAPTPIRPVSGGSSKSSVPLSETETMAEYKKRRAAGERS